MAKRIADKELTDRNWDQEEDGEEAGTFSVATEDVMRNRAIKKAKRRNVGTEGEAGGAFKGFKGFSVGPSSAPPPFGAAFKSSGPLTNGSGVPAPSFAAASSSSATGESPATSWARVTETRPRFPIGAAFDASPGNGRKEYGRQLTALNCSVRDWISKHVDDNPLCDLQPIFRDYERHLAGIERRFAAEDRTAPSFPAFPSEDDPPAVAFDFGRKAEGSAQKGAEPSAFSSFGGASRSFGETDRAAPSEEKGDAYEPPKPEVKEVKEEDAFYSKRCKLFYKKGHEFKEKGVGTLHLKETAQGKTQMIVRADTNLGNILLNILLASGMPCSRLGKSDVMVVCVPNPPVDDKNPGDPVPLLIRVKSAEDADHLHKTLEEKRG
ncbi:nuclear pore complex protein Nup50 isoform X2 [Corythoichthys intestinalis]|nr:nuclear pore complex protein Nup50 isoform X2 [Corythoichthys intestinalis]XP_061809725.1 nuclear pore complex protein Nup50-like [Nerophis lumbriciformis]